MFQPETNSLCMLPGLQLTLQEMGNYISSAEQEMKQSVKDLAIAQQLGQIKQMKRQRDVQCAMRIASTRDIVHWTGAFYTTLIVVNAVSFLRTRQSFPIRNLPMVISPFMLGFNVDLAYGIGLPGGDKMQRIRKESQTILTNEDHWFNEPVSLPISMKDVYTRMLCETNAKNQAQGLPMEREWARFDGAPSSNEILHNAYPITRLLMRTQGQHHDGDAVRAPEEHLPFNTKHT